MDNDEWRIILIIRYMEIWWYPEFVSNELKYSKPAVESTRQSIFDKEKLYLRYALLRLVKSISIHHFSLGFFIITILANHSGYITSRMNLASTSLFVSFKIAFYRSPSKSLFFYLIGEKKELMFNRCEAISGLMMLGMSGGLNEKLDF